MVQAWLRVGALWLVLGGLIGSGIVWAQVPGQSAAGVVSRLEGVAAVENGQGVRQLAPGAGVDVGDTLRTGPDARLEVVFFDGGVLTLGADTRFSIDTFVLDRRDRRTQAVFRLASGAFRMVTGKAATQSAHLLVSTPLAVIGVRGTDFWGGWLEADRLSVLLLSGKRVEISNAVSAVALPRPGYGVNVDSKDTPIAAPTVWSAAKTAKAVSTVHFQGGP